MANNTLLAFDNFTRANGSLGSNWSIADSNSLSNIVSNSAQASGVSVFCSQVYTAVSFPTDQIAECVLGPSFVLEGSTQVRLHVRYSAGLPENGYTAVLNGGTTTIFKIVAGAATSLKVVASTMAAGDIWTFGIAGGALFLYRNYFPVSFVQDSTFTSGGSPGFAQFSTTNASHTQLTSWSGYSFVQQDGVWQKQGIVIPATASVGNAADPSIIYEANAQILSGNVYKMWFSYGNGVGYAESTNGINWTLNGSLVIAGDANGRATPKVFKSGSTYYLYTCWGVGSTQLLYTSSDGMSWSPNGSYNLVLGSAGAWDSNNIFYFTPIYIDGGGTWHALYTGIKSPPQVVSSGIATSSDGITWAKYGGNPVVVNFWAMYAPLLLNGVWYAWGQSCNPGMNSGKPAIDPVEGQRMQSVDLITWTNRTTSTHHSQLYGSLNSTQGGEAPVQVIDVGGRAYNYFTTTPNDVTPSVYQIGLATAPVSRVQLVTAAENGLQQTAMDNFTLRADENPLSGGGNWTTLTGAGSLKLVSAVVEPVTANTFSASVYTGGTFNNDQYSSVGISTLTSTGYVYMLVRASTSAQTCYTASFHGATAVQQNDSGIGIGKFVAGSFTLLSSFVTLTPQVNDVFTLSVIGNVLSFFQNGYLLIQVEDNTLTTGRPGIGQNGVSAITDSKILAWAGGNANVIPSSGGTGSGLGLGWGDNPNRLCSRVLP